MADTKHRPGGQIPVEADGINYRGIAWFVAILVVATLLCEGLVLVMFGAFQRQAGRDAAALPAVPAIEKTQQGPTLLTDEPGNLQKFRKSEDEQLQTYGWIDKDAGIVRVPIDRAKQLLLQRGLPVDAATAPPASVKPAANAEPAGKAAK